jgi:predicted DNA-binding transcriptional regulator AlpA
MERWPLLAFVTRKRTMLPESGFLRLPQIIGKRATINTPAIPALIPVCKSTWWAGVRSGRFPKPFKIGERCTAWRASDIASLIEQMGEQTNRT